MDGWYYKLFDSDFGPVPFQELVALAKNNTLSRDDEVRFGENGAWRRAGSIGQLMAHFPFQAVEKVITVSTMTPASESWEFIEPEPEMDDFIISESSEAKRAARPNHKAKTPSREAAGNGTRSSTVDYTSRPAVHMPPAAYHQPAPHIHPAPHLPSVPQMQPAAAHFQPAPPSQPVAQVQPVVPSQPAPPRAPVAPPEPAVENEMRWWCMIQGKEYGPVDLPKLIEWASTGRLLRNDFVRYALQPYIRADELPELFPKLPTQLQDTKTEIETKTEIRPALAAKAVERPKAAEVQPAVPLAAPAAVAPPVETPVVSPPAAPTPSMSSMSSSGFQSGGFGASRPAMARMSPKKSSSSGGGIGSLLSSPAVLGGVGAVVAVALLVVAASFLGLLESADSGRVREMDTVLADVTKARSSAKFGGSEAKAAKDKLGDVAKRIVGQLKDTKDRKSKKVLTAANKLEEASKLDLVKPSEDEKKADAALSSAKKAISDAKRALGM